MQALQRVEKQVDTQSLDPSPEHADMIKRMLSMGLYRYLKVAAPSCIADDTSDSSVVRRWHGEQSVQTVSSRERKVCGFCMGARRQVVWKCRRQSKVTVIQVQVNQFGTEYNLNMP